MTEPIIFRDGAFSVLPDTPWIGACIANDGHSELRAIGTADCPGARGLELRADADCVVAVDAIDAREQNARSPRTWNDLLRTPTSHLGCAALSAGQPFELHGESVGRVLAAAANGDVLELAIRRLDHARGTVLVAAQLLAAERNTEELTHVDSYVSA
jgi:hypothetical protein